MSMVCPQCAASYEQRYHCPVCGARLLYADDRGYGRRWRIPGRWQHTPWGRILIGLLLSQGLFYGLRHLATAAVLAYAGEAGARELFASTQGVVLMQALQLFALLLGGMLAGSVQPHGLALGAVVGVWNGVFAALTTRGPVQALSPVALYGLPLVHAAVGALGGWFGRAVWKPLPVEAPAGPVPPRRPAPRRRLSLLAGQVAWARAAAGAAVAVAGYLFAAVLYRLLLRAGDGTLESTGQMLDEVVTWEIKALAVLGGAGLAGANCLNGLKQGLVVGVLTALVLAALEARVPDRWGQVAASLAVSSLCLSLVGGWFGSQLFPPVVSRKRLRGLGPTAA
jgi:hypothetical protein